MSTLMQDVTMCKGLNMSIMLWTISTSTGQNSQMWDNRFNFWFMDLLCQNSVDYEVTAKYQNGVMLHTINSTLPSWVQMLTALPDSMVRYQEFGQGVF